MSCLPEMAGIRDPLCELNGNVGLCALEMEGLCDLGCDASNRSVFDVDSLWEPVLELDLEVAELEVPDVSRF